MAANKGTALVTGASSGVGAVYADRLARRGYDLILVARNAARLAALSVRLTAETGRSADVLTADLTHAEDLAKVEARLAGDPAVTLLVNNAGISLNGGLLDNGPAEIEGLIAINISAPRRGWPLLRRGPLSAAAPGQSSTSRPCWRWRRSCQTGSKWIESLHPRPVAGDGRHAGAQGRSRAGGVTNQHACR